MLTHVKRTIALIAAVLSSCGAGGGPGGAYAATSNMIYQNAVESACSQAGGLAILLLQAHVKFPDMSADTMKRRMDEKFSQLPFDQQPDINERTRIFMTVDEVWHLSADTVAQRDRAYMIGKQTCLLAR